MTTTKASERYVVHELLTPIGEVTSCSPLDIFHVSECAGRDAKYAEDGLGVSLQQEKDKSRPWLSVLGRSCTEVGVYFDRFGQVSAQSLSNFDR
ncbi:hypothetical protein BV22DRAFT_1028062 [Leucogyrophana mollusca]|uniref:Uncharacterized protein n=1 Tax=Leucogyrophana mollusca TaxID=85980 RepID=A0ACB8BY42_9AGAM|nr:hypothetical protein BV22DRAFT_1028062 [Leucogyrophana mollusca]